MVPRLSLSVVLAIRLAGGQSGLQADEYHVKAAFLCNFASFVEWPAEVFHSPQEPFGICVLGRDPFGKALGDALEGKKMAGRTARIRLLSDVSETGGCQILFVSSFAGKRVFLTLGAWNQPGVLTVGEGGDPGSEGMIIKFILENGRVRFEINLAPAEEGKLHLSSRLLSLATVVRNPPQPHGLLPPR